MNLEKSLPAKCWCMLLWVLLLFPVSKTYGQDNAVSVEKFLPRPQWFNLGAGIGGAYISFWNTNVKSIFKPLDKTDQSKGLYLGLYSSVELKSGDDLLGNNSEAGFRGTYFFRNIQSKFNFYGKAELAVTDYAGLIFKPRIGAGVRWRFLYAEAAVSPVPLHAGLCWQWSAKTKKEK